MSNTPIEPVKSTQQQLEELRARLSHSTQTMKSNTQQASSSDLMSLMIKATATFEKE